MKSVDRQLIIHPKPDEDGAGEAARQAGDIKQRGLQVFEEEPEGKFQVCGCKHKHDDVGRNEQ